MAGNRDIEKLSYADLNYVDYTVYTTINGVIEERKESDRKTEKRISLDEFILGQPLKSPVTLTDIFKHHQAFFF